MSHANVAVVARFFEALNLGDLDGAMAETSPDFDWETDPRHPRAGIYHGRDEVRQFLVDLEAPFDQTVIEPEHYFARGDQVVAFLRMKRRLPGSTVDVEIQIGELWTVQDGKLVRAQAFAERHKALEAAGLTSEDEVMPA